MAFKLAVIGDSLAQGFQDGAVGATRPLWSFPAIIARALKLGVGSGAGDDFRVPKIPGDGLPLDIVTLLERVKDATGPRISALEWPLKALPAITSYMAAVEKYYEKGDGSKAAQFGGVYHNLAAYGLTVFESVHLTSRSCDQIIDEQEGWFRDDLFGSPSGAKYRAAKMVIDPDGKRPNATQLDNLDYLVTGNPELGIAPEPPDALILWLGANDCLRTVVELEVRDMERAASPATDTVQGRRAYNLTSSEQFRKDYEQLAARIDRILANHPTQVFVGTVPDVSIPPIARGLGKMQNGVFPHYVRFFVDGDEPTPPAFHKRLAGAEVARVQQRIATFNAHIRELAAARPRWHVVDVADVLEQLAVRRHGQDADPGQPLRQYYTRKQRPKHPLLGLDPVPSLLMLGSQGERRTGGGLTSLDGVHPTTLGYGIAAEAFLETMKDQNVPGADPDAIDWPQLIRVDRTATQVPVVWDDLLAAARASSLLWDLAFRTLGSRV